MLRNHFEMYFIQYYRFILGGVDTISIAWNHKMLTSLRTHFRKTPARNCRHLPLNYDRPNVRSSRSRSHAFTHTHTCTRDHSHTTNTPDCARNKNESTRCHNHNMPQIIARFMRLVIWIRSHCYTMSWLVSIGRVTCAGSPDDSGRCSAAAAAANLPKCWLLVRHRRSLSTVVLASLASRGERVPAVRLSLDGVGGGEEWEATAPHECTLTNANRPVAAPALYMRATARGDSGRRQRPLANAFPGGASVGTGTARSGDKWMAWKFVSILNGLIKKNVQAIINGTNSIHDRRQLRYRSSR